MLLRQKPNQLLPHQLVRGVILAQPLDFRHDRRGILIIAKLDRLAQNATFITNLMKSGVEFVAVDIP